jgi:hypothetical protein
MAGIVATDRSLTSGDSILFPRILKPGMKKKSIFCLILLSSLWNAGCSTSSSGYIPKIVGEVAPPVNVGGLSARIKTPKTFFRIGEQLCFDINIRNVGDRPLCIPARPVIVVSWIYSSGNVDNQLREVPPVFDPGKQETILMEPGKEIDIQSKLNTSFFDVDGITEFCAVLIVPPSAVESDHWWNGRLKTNRIGLDARR